MSLQVWLPLNGDLHNQGLSNITVTNNGATVNTSGKIGSCYNFDGNDDYISLTSSVLYSIITGGNQPFSIAMWVYHADATRAILFGDYGLGGINFNIELTTGHALRFYWAGSPDKNFTITVDASQWTHICLVYDGTQILVYKNGIIQSDKYTGILATKTKTTGAYYLGRDSRTGTTAFNGKMNDVRIYDHALSAKEVEEIAKGLVLHYKLDNNGLGNINLVTGSNTSSTSTNKWVGHSAVGGNISTIELDETGIYCVKIARDNTTQSSWDFVSYDNLLRNTIKPATIYTVSFDCKPSVNGSMGLTGFVQGNATNYMTNSTTTIQGTCIANQWNHMIYQCKTINSFDNITIGSQVVYFSRSASLKGTNVTVLFKNIKVEEGSVATPWIPATSDAIYSQFIGNINIIYDSSGYGNNGIIAGSLTTSTPSPRYSCATKFDGSSRITHDTLPSIYTLSCWCKTDKNKSTSQFMVADSGSSMCISFYNGTIIGVFGTIRSTGSKCTLGSEYKENDWNHIVVVKTSEDGQRDIYCNGVKLTPTSNNYWNATTGFWVGTRDASQTNPFYGNIVDVRAYATALTPEQIKELYNTSMSIDNKGNIHARELVE